MNHNTSYVESVIERVAYYFNLSIETNPKFDHSRTHTQSCILNTVGLRLFPHELIYQTSGVFLTILPATAITVQ